MHEAPRLSRESTDTLAAGNVVTVEPGIYLEGLGGIRIEDLVIVTDDGAEVLTSFTKEPVTRQLESAPVAGDRLDTTSSGTGCTSSSTARSGGSSSSSTSSPARAAHSCARGCKNLDSGAVVDRTFRAGEKFTRVRTEVKNVQYLYDAGDEVVFMDTETYEQISLAARRGRGRAGVLEPSSTVQMLTVDGKPAGVQLPVVGRAGRHGDRARRPWRHGLERDEAGDAGDRRDRPGAAVRERWRPHQGRPARGPLHLTRLTL